MKNLWQVDPTVLTLALIEALAGKGASQKDGYVRVADLAMYARDCLLLYGDTE